jgi:hypothetical protein
MADDRAIVSGAVWFGERLGGKQIGKIRPKSWYSIAGW